MLGNKASAKKASKFEDSGSRMSRPRAVSELPQRPSPRLHAVAGSEAGGGVQRRALGVRGTAPRSPLHEKKLAGAGAGSRVAEVTEMRERLAADEKARKDARAALVEAKKRFATKKRDDVATSAPVELDDGKVPVTSEAADVAVGANGDKGGMNSSATDAHDAVVPEGSGNNQGLVVEEAKKTGDDDDEVGHTVANGDGEKRNPEVHELRAKLMAKDMEVYELRAKLMVMDAEIDELRGTLTAKNTELDELRAKLASKDMEVNTVTANLMAKDAEIAALEADNADLTKMTEESSEVAKATATRARETEHALRESAAREARLTELLRASERDREALEVEAQRSHVQSEQWRKAAEEAAVVLGGGVDRSAGVLSGAAGTSSEKRRHSSAESTAAKDADYEGSSGKRKAGGAMRTLSDLWKKKAQK
ncbi:uncharacterized protein LOC133929222 [Phragmites australis]|uniref:uncharacterized protein LOC133929222 n=1 Tax=Phragmites australis TaxID=29695 RepID=UPI002D774D90|nr:uncharacterized protein LOC133929222 [Phragmites australis]